MHVYVYIYKCVVELIFVNINNNYINIIINSIIIINFNINIFEIKTESEILFHNMFYSSTYTIANKTTT